MTKVTLMIRFKALSVEIMNLLVVELLLPMVLLQGLMELMEPVLKLDGLLLMMVKLNLTQIGSTAFL